MIKLNLHIIAWLLVALFAVTSYFLFRGWLTEKANASRLQESAIGLDGRVTELSALNGQLIAQNQVLQLQQDELEAILPEIKFQIENLKVKLTRAEKYSETGFSVAISPSVILKDSFIFDTIRVKTFAYHDENFLIKGVSKDSIQHLELSYQDTLIQVVYRGDRPKPWLWFFSKRPLMQRVSLKNPHTRIHYSQVIQIED